MLEMKYRPVSELKELQGNPRTITKAQFEKLKTSIKNNADYFEARPIILSDRTGELVVIAGNQRLKASKALGLKEVPTVLLEGLTEDREREIIIRDNVENGEWDMDILANEWDKDKLEELGVLLRIASQPDYKELLDVNIPYYTPAEKCPDVSELADFGAFEDLIGAIDLLKCEEPLRNIMRTRACFFVDFDFQKIADYYAHADKETQFMMKKLGLVIVVPKEAYEMGMCDFREGFDEQR